VVVKPLGPESHVGHDCCEGNTVVMDLAGIAGPEAAPLVDFAAGLIVALGAAMERVAPELFLLVPPGKLGRGAAGHPVGVPA
jgi:cell division inhibitor SepF